MIIGIEGPAGSGKSTMAKTVAREIGATVIEGGLWYRAITFLALKNGIKATDTQELVHLAENINLDIKINKKGESDIFIDNLKVTDILYTEEISTNIAPIAQNLEVRKIIEREIVDITRSKDFVIIVGRHIQRALPEAKIIRLEINEAEADKRHLARSSDVASSVMGRNNMDKQTAKMLGSSSEGVTIVDVSDMSIEEQAEMLRLFISKNTLEQIQ